MTPDEMIYVIQSHKEGKKLQYRKIYLLNNSTWKDCDDYPDFNFLECEYRVKPEETIQHYRPFKNAEEVMEAIKEHGMFLKDKKIGSLIAITGIIPPHELSATLKCKYGYAESSVQTIASMYTFADGTPFGVKEE